MLAVAAAGACAHDTGTNAEDLGSTYLPANGSVSVLVAVKNHQSGDATYFVDVHCAG